MNNDQTSESRITLAAFTAKHGITLTVKPATKVSADRMKEFSHCTHYSVTLNMDDRRMGPILFSQGIAIKDPPTVEDVLNCVSSDVAGYENARSFEDWASEYGYDTDSRKAEKIYKEIGKQAEELKALLGDSGIYETLLWNTESL